MKRALLSGFAVAFAATLFAVQTGSSQTTAPIKVLGCLQGDGSEQSPWVLSGVAIPEPPTAAPAGGGRGGRGDGGGARGGRGGDAGGGGRGGGGRGAAPPAPAPPPEPVELVDLRLTGGMDMSPWRGMRIEAEGTLGSKPATGMQALQVTFARSVQGLCPQR